jgi:hypothetical protein
MRTRLICGALAAAVLTQISACGTLFYPERRGQITGQIDPGIAILDAVGLLFYIIPGLVAFGVDFASGAIYLPNDEHASVDPAKLKQAIGPDGKVDNARLKTIVEQETGYSLPLTDHRLIQRSGSPEQLAAFGLRPAA